MRSLVDLLAYPVQDLCVKPTGGDWREIDNSGKISLAWLTGLQTPPQTRLKLLHVVMLWLIMTFRCASIERVPVCSSGRYPSHSGLVPGQAPYV